MDDCKQLNPLSTSELDAVSGGQFVAAFPEAVPVVPYEAMVAPGVAASAIEAQRAAEALRACTAEHPVLLAPAVGTGILAERCVRDKLAGKR